MKKPHWALPTDFELQLTGILFLAVILAQIGTVWLLTDDENPVMDTMEKHQVLEFNAAVVDLLRNSPATQQQQILNTLSIGTSRYWIDSEPFIGTDLVPNHYLQARLAKLLEVREKEVRVYTEPHRPANWHCDHFSEDVRKVRQGTKVDENFYSIYGDGSHPCVSEVLTSINLGSLGWLNTADNNKFTVLDEIRATNLIVTLGLALILIVIVIAGWIRYITRPMRALSEAAEQSGRGNTFATIPEQGPLEVRKTVHAFNRMQGRIQQFVQDRLAVLGAISHDLRTPVTSMRLRVELMDKCEDRQRLLSNIEDMEAITSASLELIEFSAVDEESRNVNLNALVSSLCDDLVYLGLPVSYKESDHVIYRCHPRSLKRALDNVIRNAVRYGFEARVNLHETHEGIKITVQDRGDGIPQELHEHVFEPFIRLDKSRKHKTGGVGLGLSITRTIVRNHGGEISLKNTPAGLKVTIMLPREL
ncbi:MAG: HAMP domain-containing protein [Betaproteobacteria bacterium]|nr:HAMP domain-containing protein [Betaproteobacteria bacterium]